MWGQSKISYLVQSSQIILGWKQERPRQGSGGIQSDLAG